LRSFCDSRRRSNYEALGAEVRAGPVICSDETGARVGGRTAWYWVFQAPSASYHAIVPRRNAEVITALLGDAHPEGWVSDLWSPQLHVDAGIHQMCLAHQMRNPTYAVEADGYTGGSGPSNCAICLARPSTCTRSASANSASASGSQCCISIER